MSQLESLDLEGGFSEKTGKVINKINYEPTHDGGWKIKGSVNPGEPYNLSNVERVKTVIPENKKFLGLF